MSAATSALGTWLPGTCATARPQLAKADTAFQAHPLGQPTEPCLGEHRALWLCLALIHAAMLDTVALAAGQQQCESQHC
jgi:hypothetical protein